jgi:hypothetical protein
MFTNESYPYSFMVCGDEYEIRLRDGDALIEVGKAPGGTGTVEDWICFAEAKITNKFWRGYERPNTGPGDVDPLGPSDKVTGGVSFPFRLV